MSKNKAMEYNTPATKGKYAQKASPSLPRLKNNYILALLPHFGAPSRIRLIPRQWLVFVKKRRSVSWDSNGGLEIYASMSPGQATIHA
jgi:hypothetical protein